MRLTALILCHRKATLAEVEAIATTMLDDGRFEPVLLAVGPNVAALSRALLERVRVVDLAGNAVAAVPRESGDAGAAPSRLGSLRQAALRWPGLRALMLLRGVAADRRAIGRLFDRCAPAALLVFDDRTPRPDMVLLRLARQHVVPSVLVPYAASSVESDLLSRRGRVENEVDRGLTRPLRRWFAARHPEHVATGDGRRLLFFSFAESLALAAAGLLGGRSWVMGGGEADAVAVFGEEERETLAAAGIALPRVAVTGQASLDPMFRRGTKADALRETIRQRYGLRRDAPVVVCAVPQLGEHALVDWERHWRATRQLFAALSESGAATLLSLHPKSDRARYGALAREFGLALADERLSDVLPAADLFVASYSSTVRWAVLLGVPALVIDSGLGYRMYDHLSGIVKTADPAELGAALRRLVADASRRADLAAACRRDAARLGIADGRAGARIVDLVAALVASRARAASVGQAPQQQEARA